MHLFVILPIALDEHTNNYVCDAADDASCSQIICVNDFKGDEISRLSTGLCTWLLSSFVVSLGD
jgi:hypothetical protein